jgi:hypothetical protein
MRTIMFQHEIDEELEKRSGVKGLKLIRLKGYVPSWDVGGLREKPLDDAGEAKLRETVIAMQNEYDMAWPKCLLETTSSKMEFGGQRITDRNAATAFLLEIDRVYRGAHWRSFAETLRDAPLTESVNARAGAAFRTALETEGWLDLTSDDVQ